MRTLFGKFYRVWKNFFLINIKFRREFNVFLKHSEKYNKRFPILWKDSFPCLNDRTETTGFEPHYTYHPAWAARVLEKIKPEYHIDISSTLSFCSIVSAFIPVRFYDYRPANLNLSNLSSEHTDLTQLQFPDNSISSISCMHVIEHIGLGRYGDPIDPEGDLKAIKELKRVTAKGGNLIFVTPIGLPKIQFNAHRIYSYEMILDYFDGFTLNEFSLVTDNSDFIINANKEMSDAQNWGCGCFWFVKK